MVKWAPFSSACPLLHNAPSGYDFNLGVSLPALPPGDISQPFGADVVHPLTAPYSPLHPLTALPPGDISQPFGADVVRASCTPCGHS